MDTYYIVKYTWAFFLAIGPILGYIPQYIDIKRTRHYSGFSSAICFILLTSNILRILSYFLKSFDVFLLAQSIFMIIVQLLMLHLIVKLKARDILPSSQLQSHVDNSARLPVRDNRSLFGTFWAWKSFAEYLIFLAMFTAGFIAIILIEIFLYPSEIVKEGFLYTSTLIESTLCIPQVYTNWKNKGTLGLNKSLVASWIAGDLFKLFYFFYSSARMAFKVCAFIQIGVDLIIIVQILYYKPRAQSHSLEKSEITRPSSTVPLKAS